MPLISIAGVVAKKFDFLDLESLAKVEFFKNNNLRDVVTTLDSELHEILSEFCAECFPDTLLLSEEGADQEKVWKQLVEVPSVMVVDPVDGSNNLVCGLRDFGFMVCLLRNAKFVESLIILPNENQVLSWSENSGLLMSKKLPRNVKPSASAYLAYKPQLADNFVEVRSEIVNLLELVSSGVYRYGSACVGLFRTLIGGHSTFIGLEMRPWDVIPFFPILHSSGAALAYSASESEISVLISYSSEIFAKSREILSNKIGDFLDFNAGDALKVTR